jgi:hypothetical protein
MWLELQDIFNDQPSKSLNMSKKHKLIKNSKWNILFKVAQLAFKYFYMFYSD